MIARYKEQVLSYHKPKWISDQTPRLNWWDREIGHILITEITPAVLVECRDKLVREVIQGGRPRSQATANRYIGILSHAFTIAINEWDWLSDNPFRKVRKFKEPRGRTRYLSIEELEQPRLF